MKIACSFVVLMVLASTSSLANAQEPSNIQLSDAQRAALPADVITTDDLAILDGALALLSSESVWNRRDDIVCDDDESSGVRSLYCAVKKSSTEVLGQFNNDRAALQELRNVILEKYDFRRFEHSLKDFNNMADTSLADVQDVLEKAKQRTIDRLREETNPGRPDVRDL